MLADRTESSGRSGGPVRVDDVLDRIQDEREDSEEPPAVIVRDMFDEFKRVVTS